ncbi:hypothetical protein [Desulfovibrio sp. JC022]|uniref:hypothetical protein n=1 Tax=Desulfovibrio sp. JC022 TaxID=2593642 RepID=UPI0013D682FE|nr:hypothetical protein [Desulfovibrio sp. JC022]NDV22538.1 hypothetical protein [Desulfovibrio sp. JC022]
MINKPAQIIHSLTAALLLCTLVTTTGCSFFYKPIEQAQQYALLQQYDAAVDKLTDVIDSDASEEEKAQAFMLRGEAYTSLKEYRYAYRDLQVAWKLSCHIYQTFPTPQLPAVTEAPQSQSTGNSTQQEPAPKPFTPARACIEQLPRLIDELKPFTSEFGAIMSTQEASAIVKEMFPDMPR